MLRLAGFAALAALLLGSEARGQHAGHSHAEHAHTAPESAGTHVPSPPVTAADVRFMRDMIPHHAQALDMTALVTERSQSAAVRTLARRIEASQGDEIAMMQRWLERHDPSAAHAEHDMHAAHSDHGSHAGMPGMLTAAQMAELGASSGDDFDRLFLTRMISHHEGALTMVADLLGSVGGAQDPETFAFASHVESDQRSEILRMRRMLPSVPTATP